MDPDHLEGQRPLVIASSKYRICRKTIKAPGRASSSYSPKKVDWCWQIKEFALSQPHRETGGGAERPRRLCWTREGEAAQKSVADALLIPPFNFSRSLAGFEEIRLAEALQK